ncbi:MAG: hypothetical protein NT090_02905, partial [Acidobacteria bacterium]|nr:hypothetical protein [Acidobacteriota bacterium]
MAELIRRGFGVDYFATERFRREVESTGASFFPYTPAFHMPQVGQGPFARVTTTLEALLDLAEAVLLHHIEDVRSRRPVVLMHDSGAPWGYFLSQLLALPAVTSVPSIGVNSNVVSRYGEERDPSLTTDWFERFAARCAAFAGRHRLPAVPSPPQLLQPYGALNLVYTSRLFQPLAAEFDLERFKFVGPCIGPRSHDPPLPFHALGGGPLVYVSVGSVYHDRAPFFRMCVEALADGPWQVVMATGWNTTEGQWDSLPTNFAVQPFVPQMEILKRAAVFVTH